MPNQLAQETSPYLLQYAQQPVDWLPWGEAALAQARAGNKPILLSIGYSACHWCHVMAHESFDDPATAQLMNERFVNIKVDREERPDLDQIYQQAHQMLTRQGGGWPLTIFLSPEGVPFHSGTCYPPKARFGRPAFRDLLDSVAAAWQDKREAIATQDAAILQAFANSQPQTPEAAGTTAAQAGPVQEATRLWAEQHLDATHGGFGAAPKFPHPTDLASARQALDFIRQTFWVEGVEAGGQPRLLATAREGRAHLDAYLDDHAFLLEALLAVMQADFHLDDLHWAQALADQLLAHFEDREHGGFFFTRHDHDALIHRPRSPYDNATPSGNGVAAFALQRLGHLRGESRYLLVAERILALFAADVARQPATAARLGRQLAARLPAAHPRAGLAERGSGWFARGPGQAFACRRPRSTAWKPCASNCGPRRRRGSCTDGRSRPGGDGGVAVILCSISLRHLPQGAQPCLLTCC